MNAEVNDWILNRNYNYFFFQYVYDICWQLVHSTKLLVNWRFSGIYSNGVPPLPIPNREVKPISADGTAERWESRSMPTFKRLIPLRSKTLFLCSKVCKTITNYKLIITNFQYIRLLGWVSQIFFPADNNTLRRYLEYPWWIHINPHQRHVISLPFWHFKITLHINWYSSLL